MPPESITPNGGDSASSSVRLGDIDGDGKLDIVVPISWPTNDLVAVYQNLGSSGAVSFAPKVIYASGQDPAGVIVGDLDLDGKPDLVTTRNQSAGISVLRNNAPFESRARHYLCCT